MKKENTAIRLKRIMSERNIRQIDILNLSKPICEQYGVKMNRSDISQYCSGKVEPNQDKLFVLSKALNVNESWLMGYGACQVKGYACQRKLSERPNRAQTRGNPAGDGTAQLRLYKGPDGGERVRQAV